MIDDLLLRSINFIALVLELSPFYLWFGYLSYIYVKHGSIIPGYRNYILLDFFYVQTSS